jgi:hypothetical protein
MKRMTSPIVNTGQCAEESSRVESECNISDVYDKPKYAVNHYTRSVATALSRASLSIVKSIHRWQESWQLHRVTSFISMQLH